MTAPDRHFLHLMLKYPLIKPNWRIGRFIMINFALKKSILAMKLDTLYKQIMGDSKNGYKENDHQGDCGFFSLYEKSDYDTRTYSNLDNVKI